MEIIDKLDLDILSLLIQDAKIPYKDIAGKHKISLGTVHTRIKKLEAHEIINNYTVDVDFSKIGYELSAFIGLIIDGKSHQAVARQLTDIDEITELHHTSGQFHMLAKVICTNTQQLKNVLINKINKIKGIEKTETTISLVQLFSRPASVAKPS